MERRKYYPDLYANPMILAGEIPGLLEDIVVNPQLDSILSPLDRGKYNSDFMRSNLALALPIQDPDFFSLSPHSFRRAVTSRQLNEPIVTNFGHVYDTFIQKGVLPSGDLLNTNEGGTPSHPNGFFGDRDAQLDMERSNNFIMENAKVAVPIGYVVLKPHKLIDLLKTKLTNQSQVDSRIQGLKILKANGDTPVVYFRIGASPIRFDHLALGRILPYHLEKAMQLMVLEKSIQFKGIGHHVEEYIEWLSSHFNAFFSAVNSSAGRPLPREHALSDKDIGGASYDFEGVPQRDENIRHRFIDSDRNKELIDKLRGFLN